MKATKTILELYSYQVNTFLKFAGEIEEKITLKSSVKQLCTKYSALIYTS